MRPARAWMSFWLRFRAQSRRSGIGCPKAISGKSEQPGSEIPDLLLKQVNEVAVKETVSVDQMVSIALAAQVCAAQARERITSRAKRVDRQIVDDILARVPADPPLPGNAVP